MNAAPLIALTIAKCKFDTPVDQSPTPHKHGVYQVKTAYHKFFWIDPNHSR